MNWHLSSYGSLIPDVEKCLLELSSHCSRVEPIGLLPSKAAGTREIRLLAIPKSEEDLQLLQKITSPKNRLSGSRTKSHPVKLHLTTEDAWFASLVQATSFRELHITIATAAKNRNMKWVPAKGGFEDLKTGRVRFVRSEEEVFEIVGLPYVPPEERNRCPVFGMKESGLPPSLSKDEMRGWVKAVPWTDTTCGGELHQYTFRTSGDERTFVHVAECIREYGYDGVYLRKKWRYLDLDGIFYFTCGARMEVTSLINRKRLRQPETPWVKNPEPWIPLD